MGFIKDIVRKWLGIQPAGNKQITIRESLSFEDNALCNRIWYRGDPQEIAQFYEALGQSGVNKARFWASVPLDNETIRKTHAGLPALIVDSINDITNDDCLGVKLNEEKHTLEQIELWEKIQKDNKLDEVQKDATKDTLVEGDGAFKFSIDTTLSKYPIIEFFSGNRVEYVYKRNRLMEILFFSYYSDNNNKEYTLIETYGVNYIKYKLVDNLNKEVPLTTLEETAELPEEGHEFVGDFIMAVPLRFFKSSKYKNRGQCIFEIKRDSFDALDEVVSSWLDAFRLGRAEKFIPDDLIPRDATGAKMSVSSFTNRYRIMKKPMDESQKIEPTTVQPEIPSDQYLAGYIQFLDMSLMGIVSPSTLGIDVKKLDNGEAQREKEKQTMYTRNKIIGVLQKVMPQVVSVAMKTYDLMYSRQPQDYEATIEFGEYNNPSYEAVVETVGKAYTYGIMSTEEAIDQMYGDTKTEEEKELEVQRIKSEKQASIGQYGSFGLTDPNLNEDDFFNDGDDK